MVGLGFVLPPFSGLLFAARFCARTHLLVSAARGSGLVRHRRGYSDQNLGCLLKSWSLTKSKFWSFQTKRKFGRVVCHFFSGSFVRVALCYPSFASNPQFRTHSFASNPQFRFEPTVSNPQFRTHSFEPTVSNPQFRFVSTVSNLQFRTPARNCKRPTSFI
jgi:hypothetical protein